MLEGVFTKMEPVMSDIKIAEKAMNKVRQKSVAQIIGESYLLH